MLTFYRDVLPPFPTTTMSGERFDPDHALEGTEDPLIAAKKDSLLPEQPRPQDMEQALSVTSVVDTQLDQNGSALANVMFPQGFEHID